MSEGKVLIICGDELTSQFLKEKLVIAGGYNVVFESTGTAGLAVFKQSNFDLVIVQLGVPDMAGVELVKGLKAISQDAIIIIVTEDFNPTLLKELARLGIYDFLSKPINSEKLLFLAHKGMELHSLISANHRLLNGLQEQNSSLQKQNILLAKRIEESTKNLGKLYEDLRSTYMRTIKVLAHAIDARDHYTHSHSENVAAVAEAIARQLGFSVKDMELLREACELHDLGKIGIEDSILTKPDKLTEQEWIQIKKHPQIGAQILEPLTFLNGVTELVRQHHEHYDGSGYPEGMHGEDILLGARIINVADSYEAMTSARSYRKVPLSKQEAVNEIKNNSGTQFDPRVVEAFMKVVDNL